MDNSIFDTYKTPVIYHGRRSYQKELAMAMATICAYP